MKRKSNLRRDDHNKLNHVNNHVNNHVQIVREVSTELNLETGSVADIGSQLDRSGCLLKPKLYVHGSQYSAI